MLSKTSSKGKPALKIEPISSHFDCCLPCEAVTSFPARPPSWYALPHAHGRWRVLYRVMGHMVMLFIVPAYANTLNALDLLERAVRVVTQDFRSVETTPEKLWRRYPEVREGELGGHKAHAHTVT